MNPDLPARLDRTLANARARFDYFHAKGNLFSMALCLRAIADCLRAKEMLKTVGMSLLCLWLAGCATHCDQCDANSQRQAWAPHGIPNFAVVDEQRHIYRGGQPTDEGWLWLKANGVTLDVKLDTDAEGSDAMAERVGIMVWKEPVTMAQQLGLRKMPMAWFVDCVLPSNGVFIHCLHGQDRTGLAVALLRVQRVQNCESGFGWRKADAYQEMMNHGFHQELGGLWRFWRETTADLP